MFKFPFQSSRFFRNAKIFCFQVFPWCLNFCNIAFLWLCWIFMFAPIYMTSVLIERVFKFWSFHNVSSTFCHKNVNVVCKNVLSNLLSASFSKWRNFSCKALLKKSLSKFIYDLQTFLFLRLLDFMIVEIKFRWNDSPNNFNHLSNYSWFAKILLIQVELFDWQHVLILMRIFILKTCGRLSRYNF